MDGEMGKLNINYFSCSFLFFFSFSKNSSRLLRFFVWLKVNIRSFNLTRFM